MEMTKDEINKVYVAIGRDSYDGFTTLQWTLSKWCGRGITIVILHVPFGSGGDYVYTPLGKLHVSSVSEEKLKDLEIAEEAKSDKILSQYIAYCGKVKVEVIKLEKNEQQPLDKWIVEIMTNLRITKLVMSFALMKSSSWKSKTAISGSFYILRRKPDFCEVFVICGGKLITLRDHIDKGFVEDNREISLGGIKDKSHHWKTFLGKMFQENSTSTSSSLPSSKSNGPVNQWMEFHQEVEQYANELISLCGEEDLTIKVENGDLEEKPMDLYMLGNMEAKERIQLIKNRLQKAIDTIKLNKKQANEAKERGEKARWAIFVCNARVEEMEACINSEVVKNVDLSKELNKRKEVIHELQSEVEEKRKKLDSILELQNELSNKLHLSTSAKARGEVQLEKTVRTRADMVQEIEELRKHRGILQRRIEFCKEKDAIEKACKLNGFGFGFREFSTIEILTATENFSKCLRLKSINRLTNVYKGRLNYMTVAIKVYDQENAKSLEDFSSKVKLLSQLRHPKIVAMIGFCLELKCIVYEYMPNNSLHDALFSTERSCKRKDQTSLNWHARIRISAETCSALAFLHKAKPKPIIHGNLNPSKILLDRHQMAKINGLKGSSQHENPNIAPDIHAFGNLLVQLLTNKNWEERMGIETSNGNFLDHLYGEWPMDLAMKLYNIAMMCLSKGNITKMPIEEINNVKKRAEELLSKGEYPLLVPTTHMPIEIDEMSTAPGSFLCPIYQEVMKNPHLAADGFSYELEAIDEWLSTGHNTSPMTNLRLKHKILTPNHVLRSLIQDWRNKRSVATSTKRP